MAVAPVGQVFDFVGLFTQFPAEFLYEPEEHDAAFAAEIELFKLNAIKKIARTDNFLCVIIIIYF
jgi:hypothetical protein